MAANVSLVDLARTAYMVYRQCWETQGNGYVPPWEHLLQGSRTCWLAAVTAVVGQLEAAREESADAKAE